MKKITLNLLILLASSSLTAQYNTPWTTTTSNSASSGYIGIGTKPTTSSTLLPGFNFQVHGLANYSEDSPDTAPGGSSSGMTTSDNNHNNINSQTPEKSTVSYGVTSRIGLTNTLTGQTSMDGTVLMQSQYDFAIKNRENGNLLLSTPSISFLLSGGKAWIGSTTPSLSTSSKLNVISNDNGLYIQTTLAQKTGVTIKSFNDAAPSIVVYGTSLTAPNFKVFGSGYVYARKYYTTLTNFPDYVFSPSYNLMGFEELRHYLSTNNHLPNFPTANEVEENGADLGEINRLLVEKVEELTLYVLQLEERMKKLENSGK